MIRIAVLSDTHGLLRDEVLSALSGCDLILHGGDINRQEILDRLSEIAPVYAVRGNNDKEWAEDLPLSLELELYGIKVYMTHRKKDLPADTGLFDLVVFGHSHRYETRQEGHTLFLNPGSCGPRRFNQPITLALVEIDSGRITGCTRVDIPHVQAGPVKAPDKKQILQVMQLTDRQKTVSQIAAQLHMDPELAETICRLYLTHPGVDAEGIMRKLGL